MSSAAAKAKAVRGLRGVNLLGPRALEFTRHVRLARTIRLAARAFGAGAFVAAVGAGE